MSPKLALALLSAAALSAPAFAKDAPPPKGHFGSEWYTKRTTYRAQMGVNIPEPATMDPTIYREVAFDWRASRTNTGPYPKEAFARLQEGDVAVSLDTSETGTLKGCTVTKGSGVASIDAHVCPHLMRTARFTPRMDKSGASVAATISAMISYELTMKLYTAAAFNADTPEPLRAAPLAEITSATMGLTADTPPGNEDRYITYRLAVDAAGVPTACLIRMTKGSNALDKRICDGLMANARFKPGRLKDGTPTAAEHWGGARWDVPAAK